MFLNPAMLAGLAALAVPVIVHLLNRRRFRRVPWAAMRFLRASVERNRRRMEMEDWILLALRLLIVALLALALARPTADWIQGGPLGAQISSAVVIDASASMARRDAGAAGTRFDRAKALAADAIEGLPPGSAAAAVAAADTPGTGVREPTLDLRRAARSLQNAQVTGRQSDLFPALEAAIGSLEERGGGARELLLITDGEASAWRQFDGIVRRLEEAGDDIHAVVALVAGEPGENLAVTRLEQGSPVAAVNAPLRLSVEVSNFGTTESGPATLRVEVDGAPSGEPVEIGPIAPGESRGAAVFAQLTAPGYHRITAGIEGSDALPGDDSRTLVVRAVEQERALLVDGDPGRDGGETFFLRNALVPVPAEVAPDFYLAAETVPLAALAGIPLDGYRAVFLANVAELTSAEADRLTEYVRAGGGLIVFAGDNLDRSFYNRALHSERGLLPAAFGELIEASAAEAPPALASTGYDHPILEPWRAADAGSLAGIAIRRACALDPSPPTDAAGGTGSGIGADGGGNATVVLRYADGRAAIVEGAFGLGKVFQLGLGADTEWSDLPATPAFLPLVHQLFGSVLGSADAGLNLVVGEPFVRRGPAAWAGSTATVFAAGGRGDNVLVEASPDGSSKAVSPPTEQAGAYEFTLSSPPLSIPFAANPAARESDPQPLSAAQLIRLREVADVVEVKAGTDLAATLSKGRRGGELWPLLLGAALLLALLEMFLAQKFSKAK